MFIEVASRSDFYSDISRGAKGVFRDVDGVHGPGLASIASLQIPSHPLALAQSLDVVGIGGVESDGGVGPR